MKTDVLKHLSTLLAISLSATVGFAMSLTISAASSVIVSVEAFTVGAGFVSYPTQVGISMGDTGVTVVEKVLGSRNINKGNGVGTAGITSVAFEDTDYCSVDGDIGYYFDEQEIEYEDELATDGWIANDDFVDDSAWVFVLNNKVATTSLANYVPQQGDVIRICYSLTGNGSDLAINSTIFPATNRDQLYKYFSILSEDDYSIAENVAMDLTVEQAEINETVAFLAEEYATASTTAASSATGAAATTAPGTNIPSLTTKAITSRPIDAVEADSAPTGVNLGYPLIVTAVSGGLMLFASRKSSKK